MTDLASLLARHTRESALVDVLDNGRVRCLACAHHCAIPPGGTGLCGVRLNAGGTLRVPWGYVAGASPDPIEKKPFFHVVPGSVAFSFGMLGCDFHCDYCQNWLSSQVLRDEDARARFTEVGADDLVTAAQRHRASSVISTYNEPLISLEWAIHVFSLARAAGLRTGVVSNGFATGRALDAIGPHLDMAKIDLKTMDDRRYRELGGRLQPVLETIVGLHARGIWVEVVTLLVPDFNDRDDELRALASFLVGVSPSLPWHVTAFHPDYRMTDRPSTRTADLARAAALGRDAGLQFVYAGNLQGRLGSLEDTHCPACRACVIERRGFRIEANRVSHDGRCPSCATPLPGLWTAARPARQS